MFEEERLGSEFFWKQSPLVLGKQSYPATRQGKVKRAGGEGGEEQSLCSPHVPGGLRCRCKGGVLSWCLSVPSAPPALLPNTHLGAGQWAPSFVGCGVSPQPPILSHLLQETLDRTEFRPSQSIISSLFQTVCSSYTLALWRVIKICLWNATWWNSLIGVVVEHLRVNYTPCIRNIRASCP